MNALKPIIAPSTIDCMIYCLNEKIDMMAYNAHVEIIEMALAAQDKIYPENVWMPEINWDKEEIKW